MGDFDNMPKHHPERLALCEELPRIQERLFRCGLLKTAHEMDAAIKRIGFETADYMSKAQKP